LVHAKAQSRKDPQSKTLQNYAVFDFFNENSIGRCRYWQADQKLVTIGVYAPIDNRILLD
jgi:hypothetical protein